MDKLFWARSLVIGQLFRRVIFNYFKKTGNCLAFEEGIANPFSFCRIRIF